MYVYILAGVLASISACLLYTSMIPDLVQPDEETRMRAWKVLHSLDEAIAILRMEARG